MKLQRKSEINILRYLFAFGIISFTVNEEKTYKRNE